MGFKISLQRVKCLDLLKMWRLRGEEVWEWVQTMILVMKIPQNVTLLDALILKALNLNLVQSSLLKLLTDVQMISSTNIFAVEIRLQVQIKIQPNFRISGNHQWKILKVNIDVSLRIQLKKLRYVGDYTMRFSVHISVLSASLYCYAHPLFRCFLVKTWTLGFLAVDFQEFPIL